MQTPESHSKPRPSWKQCQCGGTSWKIGAKIECLRCGAEWAPSLSQRVRRTHATAAFFDKVAHAQRQVADEGHKEADALRMRAARNETLAASVRRSTERDA